MLSVLKLCKETLLITLLATTLYACGGGSSSNNNENSGTIEVPSSSEYTQSITPQTIVAFDHNVKIGQSVDLFLYYPDDNISNINWQQTSGENITLLTPNSKGIAFTPQSAGYYSFKVSFNLNNNTQRTTLNYEMSVTSELASISAILGHVVQEQNKVSLRALLSNALLSEKENITWTQLSGPSVTFSDPLDPGITTTGHGDSVIYFTAPNVTQDTFIEFDLAINSNGEVYNDRIGLLIENTPDIASNAYFDERVATVKPYITESIHSDNIVNCVYSNTLTSSCTFNRLPLLAQETLTPSLDDIMKRVVVSHPWMAERFREFLMHHDDNGDFKNLLRATTAIVISYDIRPSFYWAATGAIYLDPNNLWLTATERDTINEAPDYRSDFGNDLRFVMPWRYVKDNDYAYSSIDITSRTNRELAEIIYRLSSLLYHELAHANDFIPATEWLIHNDNVRVLDAALDSNFESDELNLFYPLSSHEMYELANVSFRGASASNTQKSYLPSEVISFFTSDSANDYYNYTSTREDLAMLFEEFMMKTRFNVQRDIAITNSPQGENITGSDYIVEWGQRGRIGETSIKPRANFVLSRILPNINDIERNALLNALPAPLAMTQGNNWYENLSLSPSTETIISVHSTKNNKPASNNSDFIRYYHKDLPLVKASPHNSDM